MADTIKTIAATSSPTVPDYTSLQSWEDALPANLVTDAHRQIGRCLDQGEFTSAGTVLTIAGETTDSSNYILLQCASGASFKDKAGVRTTALFYNASNGVAIRRTGNYSQAIDVQVANTRLIGLQIKAPTGAKCIDSTNDGASSVLYDNLICQNVDNMTIYMATGTVSNSLIVCNGGTSNAALHGANSGNKYFGNTVINIGSAGSSVGFFANNYGTVTIQNCACFGFATFHVYTGSNATSSNNASDLGTVFGVSSNQTSLTFASQFVSSSNDFRAVSTGSLDLNGTPDATNIPTDISGTTRSASTPTIGCWEVLAAASAKLFRPANLALGAGGPFFSNPLG